MSCQSCPVWSKSLFANLSVEHLEALARAKKEYSLKRGDTIFRQGEAVRGLYCLAEGLVKVSQTNEKGRVRFVRFGTPGGTVGHRSIFTQDAYKGTASVGSETVRACFIPSATVLSMIGSNCTFAENLIRTISRELEKTEESQLAIREQTALGRVARTLRLLGRDFSSRDSSGALVLGAEFSKVDIARNLGMADETVIRLMTELKSEGVLDYRDGRIRLLNEAKLEEFSRL